MAHDPKNQLPFYQPIRYDDVYPDTSIQTKSYVDSSQVIECCDCIGQPHLVSDGKRILDLETHTIWHTNSNNEWVKSAQCKKDDTVFILQDNTCYKFDGTKWMLVKEPV